MIRMALLGQGAQQNGQVLESPVVGRHHDPDGGCSGHGTETSRAASFRPMSTAQTPAHAVDYPELVIAPPGRWSGLRLGELWAHRELIYFLTKRELQIRYKQSFFGIGWAVLQPLVFAFVFALFFGLVLKVNIPGDIPYPVFAVAGIVPWQFTSQAITARRGQPGPGRGPDLEGLLPSPGAADLQGARADPRPGDRAGRGGRGHPRLRRPDRLDRLSRSRLPAARRRHRLRARRPCSRRST